MPRRLALLLLLIAAAATLAATTAPAASAATPCWKRVINDWSDHNGTITGHYSAHCLRQAINKMPPDLASYTSIIDDISALLYDAGGQGGSGTASGQSERSMNEEQTAAEQAAAAKERKRRAERAVPHAGTSASIPDRSRSLPLPLLLLGGLAAAAALAAASPPLIKRLRARFPRLRPTSQSVRPPA